jgi:hypothetical protein
VEERREVGLLVVNVVYLSEYNECLFKFFRLVIASEVCLERRVISTKLRGVMFFCFSLVNASGVEWCVSQL